MLTIKFKVFYCCEKKGFQKPYRKSTQVLSILIIPFCFMYTVMYEWLPSN